jgi:hypothetical protein
MLVGKGNCRHGKLTCENIKELAATDGLLSCHNARTLLGTHTHVARQTHVRRFTRIRQGAMADIVSKFATSIAIDPRKSHVFTRITSSHRALGVMTPNHKTNPD